MRFIKILNHSRIAVYHLYEPKGVTGSQSNGEAAIRSLSPDLDSYFVLTDVNWVEKFKRCKRPSGEGQESMRLTVTSRLYGLKRDQLPA
jgi:hypothetical protein